MPQGRTSRDAMKKTGRNVPIRTETKMIAHYMFLLVVLLVPLAADSGEPASVATGLQREVVFTDYSTLSRSTELVRRLLSPLNAMRVNLMSKRPGLSLRAQAIDLARERFIVYVPRGPHPPRGYALLVFVPPWSQAEVPKGWVATLDRHAIIFVSASNSGNEANVLDRREPLALLAEQNIARHYPIDAQHIYVGGFSGGARVALRLALAYPDVFHGALLDAGSDPIGNAQIPLPPTDLFRRFQEATRLVYVTGANDTFHLEQDRHSRESMQGWCVLGVATESMPFTGHQPAPPAAFGRAVDMLMRPVARDTTRLDACRQRIDRALAAQLQKVRARLSQRRPDDAMKLLDEIDAHYGGLAAPWSTGLTRSIGTARATTPR